MNNHKVEHEKNRKRTSLVVHLVESKLDENVTVMEKTLANAIEMFVDAFVVLSRKLERKQEWFIDSSASKHVIRNKGCLKFLNSHNGPISFRSIGRHAHFVEGKRYVSFLLDMGKINNITNVLYALRLMKNPLLVGSIIDKRNIVIFDASKCLILDLNEPKNIITKIMRDSTYGLYKGESMHHEIVWTNTLVIFLDYIQM